MTASSCRVSWRAGATIEAAGASDLLSRSSPPASGGSRPRYGSWPAVWSIPISARTARPTRLRRLEDKMPAETLAKFKASVMLYYAGNCREKIEHLKLLPVPTQIHFADYLHGGFDKQYPDHLPPRADFGTSQEFRDFIDKAHALGHLVMPYTNPTWWCDGPKGPTFTHAARPRS